MSVAFQGRPDLENILVGPVPKVITVRVEPVAKRVRAFVGGVAIADSCRVMMMFESARLCVYYFPIEDVRTDLLFATPKVVRSDAKATRPITQLLSKAGPSRTQLGDTSILRPAVLRSRTWSLSTGSSWTLGSKR